MKVCFWAGKGGMAVIKKHFHFSSSDGIHKIHGIMWRPDEGQEIKGVLQLVHGMVEFIDRYDDFAQFMCGHGFVVAGEDHLGHGASVANSDEYGYFAKKNGMDCVVEDNYRLKKHMEREFEGKPYFILGHSMGSFITRLFIMKYSNELSGAIIMGTGNQPPLLAGIGAAMTKVIALFKGWKYRSTFINNMAFGSYNKRFAPARTPYDWLTKDKAIVDAYCADERCTFIFTLSAYRDLFGAVAQIGKVDNIRKVRDTLPVLIVSGADDPVGGFGRGVKGVYCKFKEAGIQNVSLKLYEGDRHEILNETDRKTVYEDLMKWIIQS